MLPLNLMQHVLQNVGVAFLMSCPVIAFATKTYPFHKEDGIHQYTDTNTNKVQLSL